MGTSGHELAHSGTKQVKWAHSGLSRHEAGKAGCLGSHGLAWA
jgi:hypothetical protein